MEWTIPAFAFPAKAGTHLLTLQRWKASWPWVAGWLHTKINVRHRELKQNMVAHTNQHRLNLLIKANTLTTTPDHQPNDNDLFDNVCSTYISKQAYQIFSHAITI